MLAREHFEASKEAGQPPDMDVLQRVAKALGENGQKALNMGIIMMMLPVASVMGMVGFLLYKRRGGR